MKTKLLLFFLYVVSCLVAWFAGYVCATRDGFRNLEHYVLEDATADTIIYKKILRELESDNFDKEKLEQLIRLFIESSSLPNNEINEYEKGAIK